MPSQKGLWTRSISCSGCQHIYSPGKRSQTHLDDGTDVGQVLLVLGQGQAVAADDTVELHLGTGLHEWEGRDMGGEPLLDGSSGLDTTDHERAADEDDVEVVELLLLLDAEQELGHAVGDIFASLHAAVDVVDQRAAGVDESLVELLATVDHRRVREVAQEGDEVDPVGDRTGAVPVCRMRNANEMRKGKKSLHELARVLEPVSDQRVVDGVSTHTERNGQDVVERGTTGVGLRVDGDSTGLALGVQVAQHLADFELETTHVAVDGLVAQELSCQTTVLPPAQPHECSSRTEWMMLHTRCRRKGWR